MQGRRGVGRWGWGMGGLSSLVLEPEENIEVLPYFPHALHGTEYRRLVVLGTTHLTSLSTF